MAEKLITVDLLKQFGEGIKNQFTNKTEFSDLKQKVEKLVADGGETNVIESISINSVNAQIKDKKATISLSMTDITDNENYALTDTIESTYVKNQTLTTDYKTWNDTQEAVGQMISNLGTASYQVVEQSFIDAGVDTSQAKENVLYLVKKGLSGDAYDIYIVTTTTESSKEFTKIDDTYVSLDGYITAEQIAQTYLSKSDAESIYAKTNEISSTYATKGELNNYIEESELNDKVEKILEPKKYVDETKLNGAVSEINTLIDKFVAISIVKKGAENGYINIGAGTSTSTTEEQVKIYDVTKDIAQDNDITQLISTLFSAN